MCCCSKLQYTIEFLSKYSSNITFLILQMELDYGLCKIFPNSEPVVVINDEYVQTISSCHPLINNTFGVVSEKKNFETIGASIRRIY